MSDAVEARPEAPVSSLIIRDFIPGDEEPTEAEKRVGFPTRSGAEPVQTQRPDFIPDPDAEPVEFDSQEKIEADVRAATARAMERETQETFERARERLSKLNAPEAVEVIKVMSEFERDVFLVAERMGANRKTVVEAFPAPNPAVADLIPSARAESEEDEAEPEPEDEEE